MDAMDHDKHFDPNQAQAESARPWRNRSCPSLKPNPKPQEKRLHPKPAGSRAGPPPEELQQEKTKRNGAKAVP